MDSYKTVQGESIGEIIERRSRFICAVRPAKTEEEALAFIDQTRAKYWDARHNVFAYILREQNITRYSDDGEPQGTAGMPVLNVLKASDLADVVAVVTRYFGGTLLGTGGLVRAYSQAAKAALENGHIITLGLYKKFSFACNYGQYGKIAALISAHRGTVEDAVFEEDVEMKFCVLAENVGAFEKDLSELLGAAAQLTDEGTAFLKVD